jgi:hypothetical protein
MTCDLHLGDLAERRMHELRPGGHPDWLYYEQSYPNHRYEALVLTALWLLHPWV